MPHKNPRTEIQYVNKGMHTKIDLSFHNQTNFCMATIYVHQKALYLAGGHSIIADY